VSAAHLPVDVVVPVYNASDDVRRCVDAVLARTPGLTRLVLIDDGSTDPGVAAVFGELAARGDARIELLRNAQNEGFTATANRGMRESRADVVLLNSDTIVTTGWLDSLVACAAADARIATVTPFSNNAEICSFPRFCEDNPWTSAGDAERIARALRDRAVPTYPDLPTGVGFCMLVRRAAIDALGMFDMAFGAGYGEENDFCLRAAHAGWRNVLADDAFVVHTGGRSFAGRKAELGARNLALIARRHPHYEAMVRDYVAADPLRAIRDTAISRLALDRPERGVLHVVDVHDDAAEARARAAIAASGDACRHYLAIGSPRGWRLEDHAVDDVLHFAFGAGADEPATAFIDAMAATFRITRIDDHRSHTARAPAGGTSPLSNRRLRDALGYRPWTPPAPGPAATAHECAPVRVSAAIAYAPAEAVQPRGLWHRVARRAMALRGTPMGRLLHRVTPAPLIEALKARLGG
jgi:GT2 family glycosyltransferase